MSCCVLNVIKQQTSRASAVALSAVLRTVFVKYRKWQFSTLVECKLLNRSTRKRPHLITSARLCTKHAKILRDSLRGLVPHIGVIYLHLILSNCFLGHAHSPHRVNNIVAQFIHQTSNGVGWRKDVSFGGLVDTIWNFTKWGENLLKIWLIMGNFLWNENIEKPENGKKQPTIKLSIGQL